MFQVDPDSLYRNKGGTLAELRPAEVKPAPDQRLLGVQLIRAEEVPVKEVKADEAVAEAKKPAPDDQPAEGQAKVQIAILLDTSGSMDGLIEQTKTQLWRIVNTFIDAKQNGQVPFVEVALYEYGNDGLESETHWIRQITPLTRDLDLVSKELFGLQTNGGSEFCGAVVKRATLDLKWDESPDTYKAIFIAGNEEFTQGPIDPKQSCQDAVSKGVIINTIHCGDEQAGISGGWKSGAMLADGKYLVIDHNSAVVHVDAPQDAEIVKLNEELNETYIAFGAKGEDRLMEQKRQDGNALKNAKAGASVQRVVSKASVNYHNSSWDLVDACKDADFDWTELKDEQLPEEMRKLDLEGRKKYVAEHQAKRDAIAEKIQKLNKERREFVEEKLKEMGDEGANTLDKVMVSTVRAQASKKGYEFEE
ncbi:MAG: vWA domain-containing protein [Akkermansiaceae bacterium]|nr:vWA domain-containing protein [Akkermansiaceae bacterium]